MRKHTQNNDSPGRGGEGGPPEETHEETDTHTPLTPRGLQQSFATLRIYIQIYILIEYLEYKLIYTHPPVAPVISHAGSADFIIK